MNKEQLRKIDHLCNNNINKFFELFQCDVRSKGNKFTGTCPIHCGDNRYAFNYYHSGIWKCRTHSCHNEYCGTPIGLVRGLLSRTYNRKCTLGETLSFIQKSLDTDFTNLDDIVIEKPLIIPKTTSTAINVEELKKRLIIPCPYYSKRFDPIVIKKQLIGFCDTKGKFFNQRSVVPILSRSQQTVLGCQGRSIYEKCDYCSSFHSPDVKCPSFYYPKWKATEGLKTDMLLYNYWGAKALALKMDAIFITESVGNCLRMMEFGIDNTVATFGTQFSNFQKEMIENLGVSSIIYIQDAGDAGDIAAQTVKSAIPEVHIPELPIMDDIAKTEKSYFEKHILKRLEEYI